MKLRVFLTATLLCLVLSMFAEDDSKDDKKVWFGPKFGLDVLSTTSDLSSLTDQLKGNYQVGCFLQIGKKFYFQPELYYSSYTTNAASNTKVNYVKAPLMLGLQLFDIGLVSLHLNGGPSYIKKIDSTEKSFINWEVGAGVNVLGFITTDLRYTIQKNSSTATQFEELISNGGMLNLTVGLRL